MNSTLPGYLWIPSAPSSGFAFKTQPVTNEEWNYTTTLPWHHTPLGAPTADESRLALLRHDWETGATTLDHYGGTLESCVSRIHSALASGSTDHQDGPYVFRHTGFVRRPQPALIEQELSRLQTSDLIDFGRVLIFGSSILLDLTCPSNRHKLTGPKITHEDSFVIGVSYFHAMAWCLIKNSYAHNAVDERERSAVFDLPTDLQYQQAMHAPQFAVHEKANGLMTLWTKSNPELCAKDYGFPKRPYGQRKGSLLLGSNVYNYVSQRDFDHPWYADSNVTFSPVVGRKT